MWSFFILYLFMIDVGSESISESKVVIIDQGRLRGFRYFGGNFFAFMSVPYATAPTGRDRFKAPLAPPLWMQTFDAIETGKVCPQSQPLPKIQEDCLLANIFVPDTHVTNLPVMVYVHAGEFLETSGDFFRFTNLVDSKKIIAVTFNYRLGVHGFLCLGTKDIPGNAGMKDQVALLRWIQRNIASFGGNPNDVTVVGCGAAGAAIDFLTLSPMAAGLFHKAVIEGGSSLKLDGIQLDPVHNAKVYAKLLNFSDAENITALEEFYKTTSYESLTSHVTDILYRDDSTKLFVPCVERDTGNEEMFLSKPPWNILEEGNYANMPLVFGFSEFEGLLSKRAFKDRKDGMNQNFANFLPGDLKFDSNEEKEHIAGTVKNFYFGEKNVSEDTILNYIHYFTDISYAFSMVRSLSLRQKTGNATVYLFEYTFIDENSEYIPYTDIQGAGHCSFGLVVVDEEFFHKTDEYKAIKVTVTEMWINFIKTGKPVTEESSLPEWPPAKEKWSPYMEVNGATPQLKEYFPRRRRMEFWDNIYQKYYRPPIPPTNESTPLKLCDVNTALILFYYIYIVLKTYFQHNIHIV